MSTNKDKAETPPVAKERSKKRSLVERELETSLSPKLTTPLHTNGEGVSISRFGRTRHLKNHTDFCETDKAVTKVLQSQSTATQFPVKSSPTYKKHSFKNHEATERTTVGRIVDTQIENIYNTNISLSRFGIEEKKQQNSPSPNPKSSKVYIRKDMIQTREKEETVTLIKNMFSPTRSTSKSNSHLNVVLERNSEKYNLNTASSKSNSITKNQNGYFDNSSVVKTLDFDSSKKKKAEELGEGKQIFSKTKNFETKSMSPHPVTDSKKNKKERSRPMRQRVLSESESFELDAALLQVFDSGKKKTRKESEETILLFSKSYEVPLNDSYENKRNERVRSKSLTRNRSYGLRPVTPEVGNRNDKKKIKEVRQNKRTLSRSKSVDYQLLNCSKKNNKKESGENKLVVTDKKSSNVKTAIREGRQTKKKVQQNKLTLSRSKSYDRLSDINKKTKKKGRNKSFSENKLFELESVSSESSVGSQRKKKNVQKNRKVRSKSCDQLSDGNRKIKKRDGGENKQVLSRNQSLEVLSILQVGDSSKKKKKKDVSTPVSTPNKQMLSKNELFELEAKSPYQLGDIVWARMGTFPFWPCIVTREPGSDMFVKKKIYGHREHYNIHVTFFADNGRRSWILDNMLRNYQGFDEFEAAREQFTPEAKKKDPRLYSAFFISDKKLALWHTSIEEADSLLKEPKRLRIDLLNEMLMNPPIIKYTPSKIPKRRITNRNDSDVSLSESLYDTLFSQVDGDYETPRKQKNKSLDVSEVVTACLDNMAAKTGITKIQKQSHMDIWLQKAKSQTPEKSQFNINITVERMDQDNEKDKPKRVSNRRKKSVSLRDPLHKPYSFRKSTESQHLLANQNEHDYSALGAEHTYSEHQQNTIGNTNEDTESDTPPICIIDQVISLKDADKTVQDEILANEVRGNLTTEIITLQGDATMEEDKIANEGEEVMRETDIDEKEQVIRQTNIDAEEQVIRKTEIDQEANTEMTDSQSITEETNKNQSTDFLQDTETEQIVNDIDASDKMESVEENFQDDNVENEVQPTTFPDKEDTSEKETGESVIIIISQTIQTETREIEPQIESHVNEKKYLESALHTISKENEVTIKNETLMEIDEENELQSISLSAESIENNPEEGAMETISESIGILSTENKSQPASQTFEEYALDNMPLPLSQLVITGDVCNESQTFLEAPQVTTQPFLEENLENEQHSIASSQSVANESDENKTHTHQSVEIKDTLTSVGAIDLTEPKVNGCDIDNGLFSKKIPIIESELDVISQVSTDDDKTSCNTNLISDSTRLTPITDLKQIMEETEELVTPKKTEVPTCQQNYDKIMYNNIASVLTKQNLGDKDKLTEIINDCEKLIPSSHLNKNQEVRKTRKSLRKKSKPESKTNLSGDRDTPSIKPKDSASSTKRKANSKSEPEKMKEPEFLKYLELRQDALMDEHPELCYEEIEAYLYKTWQYEYECHKSEVSPSVTNESNENKPQAPKSSKINTVENGPQSTSQSVEQYTLAINSKVTQPVKDIIVTHVKHAFTKINEPVSTRIDNEKVIVIKPQNVANLDEEVELAKEPLPALEYNLVYDEYDSEDSEPSPEYEPIEEIMEKEKDIFTAFVKAAQNDVTQEKIMRENEKTGEHLNQSNHEIKSTEYVHKQQKATTRPSSNLNLSKDDDARSANHSTESTSTVITEIMNTTKSSPTMSKISNDGDRTSCNTNLISDSSRITPVTDLKQIMEETEKLGVSICQQDNPTVLKIKTLADKVTDITDVPDKLVASSDTLNKRQETDEGNELKKPRRSLRDKSKADSKINEVSNDQLITTVNKDKVHEKSKTVTRGSKYNENELETLKVNMIKKTDESVLDVIKTIKKTSKQGKVIENGHLELVTNTVSNHNISDCNFIPESTDTKSTEKSKKKQIPIVAVENSSIVVNGLVETSDKKHDTVNIENSVCDTFSLRSEISSLTVSGGDDIDDKDFDPETISLSSLSSAISDVSVVAPRKLTRKTSFHDRRNINGIVTKKDIDRIRAELLQDSDNESVSSSEDVALSELKTRSEDTVDILRQSVDSAKSDSSGRRLKVMITDCLMKPKENKLPKVKEFSSETDVEYEIVNSPSEFSDPSKRLHLRLKKTSPTKPEKNIDLCRKESPTKLFPKVQSTDVDSALLMTKNLPSPSRKDNNKKQKSPKKSECGRSPKTKQKSPKAVSTEQEDDVFDIPLSIRRKSSPNAKKSTVSVVSPLKTKSPKTRRKSFSTCSPPKTNSDSKVKYPSRQSIISETKLTSSLDFNAAFAQSLPSSAKALLSVQTNLETKSSKISEPMPTTQVNGLHSRPSSPELQLKEPELDTISINSNDSVSSTKRKGKGRADYEKMKEPEFIQYLELKQDNVMDEHPELCYEEIVAYLYKTWQYEESRKSDLKKTDELENANLVKGVNEQSSAKPKQKAKHKRLINIVKVMNDSIKKQDTIDLLQRELPKRKASKPFYKEEFSDIEEEIEMFEIFKKKPKSADLKVEPKQETVATTDDKKEICLPDITTESIPVIPTKSEKAQVDTKEEIKLKEEEEIEEYFDQEEMYFEQLTKVKPNIFKGLIREKVCEICEETSNLVKCKGCNGMFHVDCVNKVDKPIDIVVRQRGRKKKNRNRGRKPKSSLESNEDGQSDEKYDPNASEENASFEEVKEIEPIVIIDVDDFESKLEAKMKEIIKTAVEYDSYSSDDGIDWSDTVAGKCEIVDVKLKPRKQVVTEEYSDFKCKNCQKHDVPICFVCKSVVSPRDKIDRRQRCQVPHCHKYYHLECLEHWPQTQFNTGELSRSNKNNDETFEPVTCPRHVCHTCVCDDPRGCKTRFSGDKLARCVRCPATYHSFTKCLPAGSQILSASHIVCPRHYQHRPGKVPYHVNTGWCFICALGGKLICCDFCPTSFHADCLNIEPPEGGYMCEDCETGRLPLYGEMVWVKLGHYRWWPGIVLHPSEIPDNIMAVRHSPGEFVVRFFGQYDHYWVNRGRVFPFQEGDSGRISTQKSKIDEAFTKAMEHAQRAFEILKNVEPNDEESQDIQSSLLPPHYVKLKVNKPCGALYGKKIDIEESSLTQCECNPDEEEPCGPYSHCLNRMLLTECGPTCRSGERCQNRQFEKRQYPKLVPYRTPHRGWGLKTLEHIKAGQFVIEYVGELIDEAEFRRRMRRKHEMRDENFYFLTLDKERMIDAGPKGNLARFMNHCCEPNCETQKWTVLGDIRVGLFAINDIPANTEVTFNYNLECTGIEKKQCMCGAKRCAGYIGAKPKQEDPQPKKAKMTTKMPTKRPYKKRTKLDSPSTSSSDKSTKLKRPIGRPPKPKPPRELTEIEKDLLIIKNATNGLLSSDSETSVRHDSADVESDKVNKTDQVVPKPLKRKRVSFSAEESVVVCNGVTSPSAKKHKLDEERSSVGD